MVPRTRTADGFPGAVGPGLQRLPAVAGGRRPGGRARPGHLPVLGRVGKGRADRGRVLGGGSRALPVDRRPLPRRGDRPGGHVQPHDLAALVRAARRVARPAGAGGVRPLLRRRHRAIGRRHRLGRDAQRAEPPPAAELAGASRRGARARACDAARGEQAGRRASLPGRQRHAPRGDGCHGRRHGGRPPGGEGRHQGPASRTAGGVQRRDRRQPGRGGRRVGPGSQARRGVRQVAGAGAGRRLRGRPELRARPVRRRRTRASPAVVPR